MQFAKRMFSFLVTSAALTSMDAAATDRSAPASPKARETADGSLDVLRMVTQPDMFQGRVVRVYCDHLRNPDSTSMTCRADGVSIVVDTKYISGDALRYAFARCQGMTSACSGTVSGVAEFVRGVPYITQADIEFSK